MNHTVSAAGVRRRIAAISLTLSLAAALVMVVTTCQTTVDAPDVPPVPVARPPGSLRVVSLNVLLWCESEDGRRDRMSDWLRTQQPDVVAMMELNGCSQGRLLDDAAAWGHQYVEYLDNQGDPLGLTSTAPISDVVMTREGFFYGLLEGTTHGLRFFVVHLHPWSYESRQKEVALIMERANRQIREGANVVLVGDFNALSPVDRALHENGQLRSHTAGTDLWIGVKNLRNGELDYEAMRPLTQAPLVDLMARFQPDPAERVTFPTPLSGDSPQKLRQIQRRLDYIYTVPQVAERAISARVIVDESTHWLSDHYPLIADFVPPAVAVSPVP